MVSLVFHSFTTLKITFIERSLARSMHYHKVGQGLGGNGAKSRNSIAGSRKSPENLAYISYTFPTLPGLGHHLYSRLTCY